MGLGSFLFGGPKKETSTFNLDPSSQAFYDQYRRMAGGAAQQFMNGPSMTPGSNQWLNQGGAMLQRMGGLNPQMQQALGGYQGLAGNLGFGSQTGMQGVENYMNPWINQVGNAMNAQWDRTGQMAMNQGADMATQQGAFGGSRAAVLQAGLGAQNELNRNQQMAQLYQGGYDQAGNQLMNERARMANLGLAGLGGVAGIGQYGDQQRWMQQQGLLGFGDMQRQIQQQQMMDPYMRAQMGLGLMTPGLQTGGAGTSTSTSSGGGGGLFGAALGVGGTLAGLGWNPFGGGGATANFAPSTATHDFWRSVR